MSNDTYIGKDVDWKVDKDYLQAIIDKINFPEEMKDNNTIYFDRLLVALLVQNNLLLDKMCNMLLVATGLKEEDVNEAMTVSEETIKNSVGKSTYCNTCQKVVATDRMGYCPFCKNDLSKQIFMELSREHE